MSGIPPEPSGIDGGKRPPDRFVWPPRQGQLPEPASTHVSSPPSAGRTSDSPASVPDHYSAATVWLGQTREPLRMRLARAGLELTEPSEYCPRCGISVGSAEVAEDDPASGCHHCHQEKLAWDRFVRLGEYDGELRRIVLDIKFGGWRELGVEMGEIAGSHLRQRLARSGLSHLPVVLIPVPMHFVRRMMRGVDHTAAISRGVRAGSGGRLVSALRSTAWRQTQLDVIASQREAHARAAIAAARWPGPQRLASALSRGGVVVVVDDVKTTGSTLNAACRRVRELLRTRLENGYKTLQVWGLALAVTQPGGEG